MTLFDSMTNMEGLLKNPSNKRLKQIKNIEILGPVESPIFKRKKKFRIRLLIRSKSNYISQIQIGKVLEKLNISKKIKLTVDVDPINFT